MDRDGLFGILINKIDKLCETNTDQNLTLKEHDIKLDNMNDRLDTYNKLLEIHILGVKQNADALKTHLDNESHLLNKISDKLENHEKAFEVVDTWIKVSRFLKKAVLAIGALSAATASIYALYNLF